MSNGKCHLCKTRDVSPRKSHFTPAGMSETTFGERDKEEIYQIKASQGEIDSYHGRSHPTNKNPEVKPAPHVKSDVFCKECEAALGEIESACIPFLKEVTDGLRAGAFSIKRTPSQQKFVELPFSSKVLCIYLYSVIWRQYIQQILDGQSKTLPDDLAEFLRRIIVDHIFLTKKEISESKEFSKFPDIICYTTYHRSSNSNVVNPNNRETNPELFFMGDFDALIFKGPGVSPDFYKGTALKINPDESEIQLNKLDQTRIPIINEKDWRHKLESVFTTEAKKYNHYYITQISRKKADTSPNRGTPSYGESL
jgi:hypothetical protein